MESENKDNLEKVISETHITPESEVNKKNYKDFLFCGGLYAVGTGANAGSAGISGYLSGLFFTDNVILSNYENILLGTLASICCLSFLGLTYVFGKEAKSFFKSSKEIKDSLNS